MGSESAEARLRALLRARCPPIWIESSEEERFQRLLRRLAEQVKVRVALWSAAQGLTDVQGEPLTGAQDTHEPKSLLRLLGGSDPVPAEAYLLRDLDPHLDDPVLVRRLRELVPSFRAKGHTCMLLSAEPRVPTSLVRVAERYRFPLPTSAELRQVLAPLVQTAGLSFSEDALDEAASAALGLTEIEAETLFACRLVQDRALDPDALRAAREARLRDVSQA